MFNVNFVNNLSLNDILKLKEKHSFLRSAHIGNFNKQTLILANLGIHILLHEHLRGNATIYEPSYIRYRNIKKIYAYETKEYWSNISSVDAYYNTK